MKIQRNWSNSSNSKIGLTLFFGFVEQMVWKCISSESGSFNVIEIKLIKIRSHNGILFHFHMHFVPIVEITRSNRLKKINQIGFVFVLDKKKEFTCSQQAAYQLRVPMGLQANVKNATIQINQCGYFCAGVINVYQKSILSMLKSFKSRQLIADSLPNTNSCVWFPHLQKKKNETNKCATWKHS